MIFVLKEKDGEWYYGGEHRNRFDLLRPRYVEIDQATVFKFSIVNGAVDISPSLPDADMIRHFKPVAVGLAEVAPLGADIKLDRSIIQAALELHLGRETA